MAKEKEEKEEKKESEESSEKKEGAEEGSEEGAEGEGEGKGKKKFKLSKKMIIIIAVAGLVVVGGGVTAALLMTKSSSEKEAEAISEAEAGKAASAHGGSKEEEGAGKPVYFSLGDLLVNLSGEGKRPNYLKVKISLELADEKDSAAVEALKPRIVDSFQVYLRELRIDDLRGSANIYRLREALLLRVTEIAQPVRVRDVLFQEILVQ